MFLADDDFDDNEIIHMPIKLTKKQAIYEPSALSKKKTKEQIDWDYKMLF